MIAISKAVTGLFKNDLAISASYVASRILFHGVPQRRPRAHVAPRRGQRHTDHIACLFGDGVVERDGRHFAIGPIQHLKAEILGCVGERPLTSVQDVRCMRLQKRKHARRLEQEESCVPIECVAVEKCLGRMERRLLDKASNREIGAFVSIGFDIAVTRVRAGALCRAHQTWQSNSPRARGLFGQPARSVTWAIKAQHDHSILRGEWIRDVVREIG